MSFSAVSWRAPLMGALLAGLVAVPLLWLAGSRRAEDFDREIAEQRARVEERAGMALERVAARLRRVARMLGARTPAAHADATAGYEWAGIQAAEFGLDLLELHRDGVLISSADWPERAGLPSQAPDRGLRVTAVEGVGGARAAIVHGQSLPDAPGTSLRLGSFMDAAFVDEIVGRSPAAVSLPDGRSPAVLSSSGSPAPDDRTALYRVEFGEPPSLRIEFAATPRPPVWDRQALSLLGLSLGLGALFGALTASRRRSPVARLIEAVEAVRAGRADYDFSGSRDEPWEDLAAAFSRLQRSLDTQQRRRAAAERIAAWRDVARRVAHEVKNPLVPIRLTVENLRRARDRDPALFDRLFQEGTQTILEEVDGLGRLVNEFADFARMPPMRRVTLELREWLAAQIELYRSEPGLELCLLPGAPVKVSLDAEQFGRVVKNLLSNAIEAMRDSARRELTIELREERGMFEMIVEDTGPGLDPAALGRVFEPYFTTRETGTGLGLSIVERIVVEHGGWVDVGNRPDRAGARVRLAIPLDGKLD